MLKYYLFSIIITTLLIFLLNSLYKFYKKCLIINKIPGPQMIPIIGTSWMFFGVKREDIFSILNKRFLEYGSIYRIWIGNIPHVRLSKAECIEPILNSSHHIEKSFSYDMLKDWLGEGLLTAKGEKWFHHRKIITPTFHFNILENFCVIFNEKTEILINILGKNINKKIDIYPFITRAALDIICETAMGTNVHAQESDENEYVKAVYKVSHSTTNRILKPWLQSDWLYHLLPVGREYKNSLNVLHGFTNNVIKQHKLNRMNKVTTKNHDDDDDVVDGDSNLFIKKKRLAFLDLLLDANEVKNDLTDADIREEVDTFMFEGHDTTTSGITTALFLIGQHEDVQKKLIEEIESIFHDDYDNSDNIKKNNLTNDNYVIHQDNHCHRRATLNDLNRMKYLECVIKESLRLYPPVSFIGRNLAKDIVLDGYHIPKDTQLTIEIYHLHRDERYFPNAEQFDPDRFLPENKINLHPYAYLPFSAGSRNCIGQKFAMLEEKTVISGILRNFKIKSVDRRADVKMISELIFRPYGGVNVILEKRN